MLKTIEIEIDSSGHIHLLEPLNFTPTGRALLTLLDQPGAAQHISRSDNNDANANVPSAPAAILHGRASDILALLASSRFANRPVASASEVKQRISDLRDEWNERP
jgi:hypothetical protein